jgi:thiosulfate dehydrogenase (quinone) large subunit
MFGSVRSRSAARVWLGSILWALARIWVGWQFLDAGLAKIGAPAWTGARAGAQIRQLLGTASSAKMTGGPHATVLGPYAWAIRHLFLPEAAPLAYMVTAAEVGIGAALILGLCTRAAAAGGACLNLLYLLAGSVGVNPLMLSIELAVALVGTTAGLIGVDAFLQPALRRRSGPRGQLDRTRNGTEGRLRRAS